LLQPSDPPVVGLLAISTSRHGLPVYGRRYSTTFLFRFFPPSENDRLVLTPSLRVCSSCCASLPIPRPPFFLSCKMETYPSGFYFTPRAPLPFSNPFRRVLFSLHITEFSIGPTLGHNQIRPKGDCRSTLSLPLFFWWSFLLAVQIARVSLEGFFP